MNDQDRISQSDGDEDDVGWWWWFVGNDVDDDFLIYLFRINVTKLFSNSTFKKYLHNTVLYMFPFASDTSAYHNLNVLLHSSIKSIL